MKFAFIARHHGIWQTRQMCSALGVSRGGFYEWLGRPSSRRTRENQQLLVHIRTSFEQSDCTYGSPRVWRDLKAWGLGCGKHRVERLMFSAGLQARRKRRRRPFDIGPRAEHTRSHRTCWIDSSRPQRPIGAGSRTSRTSGRKKAGCTSPSCWICSRAGSWAGR